MALLWGKWPPPSYAYAWKLDSLEILDVSRSCSEFSPFTIEHHSTQAIIIL